MSGLCTPGDFVRMPSGLLLPERAAEASLRRHQRPTAMDFFAGAGGFSLGFIAAGYEVIAASEWDAAAACTYMTNLCRWGEFTIHFIEEADRDRLERFLSGQCKAAKQGKLIGEAMTAGSGWIAHEPRSTPGVSHIFFGDVRKLTTERVLDALGMKAGELDAVVGGPPCQGYSSAGKRNVYDPRNSLVFEYARFLVELRPKAFVMEEVPNILNMVTPEGHGVIDQMCRILEDGGFGGFEALKRAVEGMNGGAALRGAATRKDRNRRGEQIDEEDGAQTPKASEQSDLPLFGGEAA